MKKNKNLNTLININNRIIYGKYIRDFFINSNKKLFTSKQYNDILILSSTKNKFSKYLTEHLGTIGGSIDAEAYKIELPNNIQLAIKIIPLTKNEMNKTFDNSYKSWKELSILKILYESIKTYSTPNIPIIYFYFICKNMNKNDYMNPNIQKYYNNQTIRNTLKEKINKRQSITNDSIVDVLYRMEKKKGFAQNSLCIMNELCDTSIKDLLNSITIEKINNNMFKNFIFQILSGVYCLSKNNIAHFDLHGGNILISYVESNKYWYYKINNKNYYIYNFGYIMKIWDFGRSIIINEDNLELLKAQLISQIKRFFKNIFKQDKNFETDVKKLITLQNIRILLFTFDFWRIISYIYSKLKGKDYLYLKFKQTIILLSKIKKDCEQNWIIPLLTRNIYNDPYQFMEYILNKYFYKYQKEQTQLINSVEYNL